MTFRRSILLSCFSFFTLAAVAVAQPKPEPDILIFTDGEKLIGALKYATADAVTFTSNIGFEVTVPWAKIQELRSGKRFGAIHKELTLQNKEDKAKVPQGTVAMTDQKVVVTPAAQGQPETLPVSQVQYIVPEKSLQRAFERRSYLKGWQGQATLGFSLFESTSSSQAITTSLNASRTDTTEPWQEVHQTTTIAFSSNYNRIVPAQPPNTIINVLHADLMHEFYIKPRFFAFVAGTWDHNYSQGLDLLQGYGAGVGRVLVKNSRSEFDVRVGVGYMQQSYNPNSLNRRLFASRFNETYTYKFKNGVTFSEMAGIRPAWNDLKNYFGGYVASLSVPVYRRFNVNISSFDNYINNPPPYFKKNTLQMSVGVGYVIK